MEQNEDFSNDPFFNDGSLQQIDASVGIDGLNNVPLPSSPFVVERILNLQACGCLNRVAWSRGGHIARIAEDGTSIELFHLTLDVGSLTWKLSGKRTEAVGLGELASLAWSPSGSDLVVVDYGGRLSMFRPSPTSSNRFTQVRSGLLDSSYDLGQAIGLYWLSQDSPDRPVSQHVFYVVIFAANECRNIQYSTHQRQTQGGFNILQKLHLMDHGPYVL